MKSLEPLPLLVPDQHRIIAIVNSNGDKFGFIDHLAGPVFVPKATSIEATSFVRSATPGLERVMNVIDQDFLDKHQITITTEAIVDLES